MVSVLATTSRRRARSPLPCPLSPLSPLPPPLSPLSPLSSLLYLLGVFDRSLARSLTATEYYGSLMYATGMWFEEAMPINLDRQAEGRHADKHHAPR